MGEKEASVEDSLLPSYDRPMKIDYYNNSSYCRKIDNLCLNSAYNILVQNVVAHLE
jgi:hypothetical protein